MIQFNLLPDVKLEYVRTQRVKHTVISAAMIAAGSAFLIFLLLFLTVNVLQKKNMDDLTKDIKKYNSELSSTPDLGKILTVQSQLGVLPDLHADKVAASRMFRYIQQITPTEVKLTDFTADFVEGTLTITGNSPSLDKVNTYVDTLKYTKYTDSSVTGERAFSSVVLSQFARSPETTTFTITTNYESALFDNASPSVSLTIPSGISTPSVVDQPAAIFNKPQTSESN